MMNLISCQQLKEKIDRHEVFKLVNALEEDKFRAMHIPGSICVCRKEDIPKRLSPDDEIVVYCTDISCNRSIIIYQQLNELGYKKIFRFAEGLRGWGDAGYKLEGERVK